MIYLMDLNADYMIINYNGKRWKKDLNGDYIIIMEKRAKSLLVDD